jgi:hypothetical protein
MNDAEEKLLKIYDGSKPDINNLFETSTVNQLAWTLVAVLTGVVLWLCIALVNAENQRHALITKQCADPVFKGDVDPRCLLTVSSRDHWWEHLWYGATHLRPGNPDKK